MNLVHYHQLKKKTFQQFLLAVVITTACDGIQAVTGVSQECCLQAPFSAIT